MRYIIPKTIFLTGELIALGVKLFSGCWKTQDGKNVAKNRDFVIS